MAGKKNVVKRAKGLTSMGMILLIIVGWLLCASTLLLNNNLRKQNALIDHARAYLEDKLYIRAAAQYKVALSSYHTEKNLEYETELLEIYKDGGMMEEYYSLIDERIKSGTAGLEEYKDRAQGYLERDAVAKAIPVLKQGIAACQDEELIALYESVRYAYSPVTTEYSTLRMPSSDWYIPAYQGEKWGYIMANGRTALDFLYEDATCFSGNYAVVKLDGVYTLIDKNGYWNAVDKNQLDQVTAIAGKKVIGVKDGKYGIYSNTFSALGSETYENAYLNDNGLIVVQKEGRWAILDSELKAVTGYQFTNVAVNSKGQVFNGNYAVVADEIGYYLINQKGEAYFEARFTDAKGMEEGLFAVADDSGRWGFADEKGELVVACQYEDVFSFSNSLAAVKYAGEWGYINKYNTMVIEPQFTQAYPFLAGKALVTDKLGNYRILSLKYYE